MIGDQIFVSDDADGFQATSTYESFPDCPAEQKAALLEFLIRLDYPKYSSLAEVDDSIARCKEWEALYVALRDSLSKFGAHYEGGSGDFFVVDQDYGYAQIKIECLSTHFFDQKVVAAIQHLLKPYSRRWEVVLSAPSSTERTAGYLISADEVINEPIS